jgi:hypothetical protein
MAPKSSNRCLWTDCIENVSTSTTHTPVGLHGLWQGSLYFSDVSNYPTDICYNLQLAALQPCSPAALLYLSDWLLKNGDSHSDRLQAALPTIQRAGCFLLRSQTGFVAHPASHSLQQSGRSVELTTPSIVEIKNVWSYPFIPHTSSWHSAQLSAGTVPPSLMPVLCMYGAVDNQMCRNCWPVYFVQVP